MKDSHKIIFHKKLTFSNIVDALKLANDGFLALVDSKNKLIGVVTDSDVRRAILNQTNTIESLINFKPFFVNYEFSNKEVFNFSIQNRIIHVPLVDENHILMDVFIQNSDHLKTKENKVVIMVGGLGKRLGDLTKNTPKPMLKIMGKPILEYILQSFIEEGFYKFIFCVNYKYEIIQNYFGDGSAFGVEINYVFEQNKLGTAGAISLIDDSHVKEPFFVVNGDVLSMVNYSDILESYNSSKADALMCVKQNNYKNPYAVVNFDEENNLVSLEEKPVTTFYFNSGIYIINNVIKALLLKNNPFDMPDLFLKAKLNNKTVKVYAIKDNWFDIGTKDEFYRLTN
jgi:dTDP-glucose pyrophosphorylase